MLRSALITATSVALAVLVVAASPATLSSAQQQAGLAAPVAAPTPQPPTAKLGVDPSTGLKYFTWEPQGSPRIDIAWGWLPMDSTGIDYERIANDDDAYIESIEARFERIVNFIVDRTTGKVIAPLQNEREAYHACFSTSVFNGNHCGIGVDFDQASGLAIVSQSAKWGSIALSAYRLVSEKDGDEDSYRVQASSGVVLGQLDKELALALDRKYAGNARFRKARGRFATSFEVAKIGPIARGQAGAYSIPLALKASGEVPKSTNDFAFENFALSFRVVGSDGDSQLKFERSK